MRTDKAKRKINYAIEKIDEYLSNNGGEKKIVPEDQIIRIKKMLGVYLSNIDNNRIESDYGIGHHITDSWPMDFDLGTTIISAELEYNKLL